MNVTERNPRKASEVAGVMATDPNWLMREVEPEALINALEIDGEFPGIDISIYLMRARNYGLANILLSRLRDQYPTGGLTFYNSAIACAGMHKLHQAIDYAKRAAALTPPSLPVRSLLARLYAIAGQTDSARSALRGAKPNSISEQRQFAYLAQFIDLCETYPFTKTKKALELLQEAGSYLEPAGCAEMILTAVRERRPFSMVRLGDGEAAWLNFDAYDEGKFSEMHRQNRTEFLIDWFGSEKLIDDDGFLSFSRRLQNAFPGHDLIGIPPRSRIDLEAEHLSVRGVSTIINSFRFLHLLDGANRGVLTCSNSINLSLLFETNFYQNLFRHGGRFGIITSQPSLADKMREHGIDIAYSYVVPGDSRNFHRTSDGTPECQYPDHVTRIDAELSSSDLGGIVFIVAAGYVGKKYLSTVRDRGGIALDAGSAADHWAKYGLTI